MSIELTKLALYRILKNKDTDLYGKLGQKLFTGADLEIFSQIRAFYAKNLSIPNAEEFLALQSNELFIKHIEKNILDETFEKVDISNSFLLDQLQNTFARDDTIRFLNEFIDGLPTLERDEIAENLQSHVLAMYQAFPQSDQVFDVSSLATVLDAQTFIVHPSGLSHEYDTVNGGFFEQELVMLGGRRGSGKSIIALNLALESFMRGHTVCYISIEMRYAEVYYRLLSMISGIPFLKFLKMELTPIDKVKIAEAKLHHFYVENEVTAKLLDDLKTTNNMKAFDDGLASKATLLDVRFFIIDDANASLSKIDNYLSIISNKHKNFKLCVVDYLNIIKIEDRMNWQSQILLADALKLYARKYNLIIISPYQIDKEGEARFAKGVLDSADRSFRFLPADLSDNPNILPFEIIKIRNGKSMRFQVTMNWEIVRINHSAKTEEVPQRILNKYGNDTKEQAEERAKDV